MTDLGWSTNTDWTNAQSSENIDINSGTFELADAIPDSGVSRWDFEQVVTDSWGDNDGTDNTSAGYTTNSTVGTYAKDFDGVNDQIDVGGLSVIDGVSEVSFAVWVNFDLIAGNDDNEAKWIIGSFSDFDNYTGFVNFSEDRLNFIVEENATNATITSHVLTEDSWQHIVATYNSGSTELYIDGSSVGTNSGGPSDYPTFSNFIIGNRPYADRYYDGQIDDLRIYSKELSSTEVSNLYNTDSIDG